MKASSRVLIFSFLIFSLIGTSCKKEEKAQETLPPPVRVSVKVAGEAQARKEEKTYSGTVVSSVSTPVSFSVGGKIVSLNFEEGQHVSKGMLLGKIEAGDYTNANNIAEAELAEARDAYDRLKKLHDNNALPEIKWVEVQQKLKQAENAVAMSRRTLSDAALYSPVNGTVTTKYANVGQNVAPGEPVCQIVSMNDLSVEVSVSAEDIGNIKPGTPAIIEFEQPGIDPIESKVVYTSSVADPLTRGFAVKVAVADDRGMILPGMLANVRFMITDESEQSSAGYILPAQAVQLAEDNRTFVWIVEGGKAERKFVEADLLSSDGIRINSGLMPGDSVIIEGILKIGSGSPVKVVSGQ